MSPFSLSLSLSGGGPARCKWARWRGRAHNRGKWCTGIGLAPPGLCCQVKVGFPVFFPVCQVAYMFNCYWTNVSSWASGQTNCDDEKNGDTWRWHGKIHPCIFYRNIFLACRFFWSTSPLDQWINSDAIQPPAGNHLRTTKTWKESPTQGKTQGHHSNSGGVWAWGWNI